MAKQTKKKPAKEKKTAAVQRKKMAVLKNKTHEAFAHRIANGEIPEAAYIAVGYSEKGARQAANRLRQRVDVSARIEEIEQTIAERVIEKTAVDKAWVIEQAVKLFETNIGQFLVWPEGGEPYYDLSKASEADLAPIDALQIDRTSTGKGEDKESTIKVKLTLPKKIDLLKLIGDHIDVGAFKKQVEHTGTIDHDHTHQHTHESVSETTQWIEGMLGTGEGGKTKEPSTH